MNKLLKVTVLVLMSAASVGLLGCSKSSGSKSSLEQAEAMFNRMEAIDSSLSEKEFSVEQGTVYLKNPTLAELKEVEGLLSEQVSLGEAILVKMQNDEFEYESEDYSGIESSVEVSKEMLQAVQENLRTNTIPTQSR